MFISALDEEIRVAVRMIADYTIVSSTSDGVVAMGFCWMWLFHMCCMTGTSTGDSREAFINIWSTGGCSFHG